MKSNTLYRNQNNIKLPIINFISNINLYKQSQIKIQSNNNHNHYNHPISYSLPKPNFEKDNKALSTLSLLEISLEYYMNKCNNKISSIPKTGQNIQKSPIKMNYSISNKNKSCSTFNKVTNKNNIVNILRSVNNLNKKLRNNNNIETKQIYKINEKIRKKLFEKYCKYNYCFNNRYYKMKKLKKIKKNNSTITEIDIAHNLEMNNKNLNKNQTQPNFLMKILLIKKPIDKNNSLIHQNKQKKYELNNENNPINNCLKKDFSMNVNNEEFRNENKDSLIKSNGRFKDSLNIID